MVVSYTKKVANLKGFGTFIRLLFRWRGSVYKMVWPDMLMYILLYYIISFVYRFALTEDEKRVFEKISIHVSHFRNLIPISFVLGFYVSVIVTRWWGMYVSMPWPDTLSILLSNHVHGQGKSARLARITVARYVNMGIVLTFTMVSPSVKKKFPGYQELLDAGYLTKDEKSVLERLDRRSKQHKTYLPFLWACRIVDQAKREGMITDPIAQKTLTDEIMRLRGCCGELLGWDDYNIPLVYTQVVTIAVYSFFLFSILGEQFLDPAQNYPNNIIDLYVPVFSLLQFFFYIGWLKVAESLINPFGDDDHDFEFVSLVTRHLEMTYLLADIEEREIPALVKDTFWDSSSGEELIMPAAQAAFLLANQFSFSDDASINAATPSV
ncbi:bestrophin-1-like isoform X2 [Portunus trituberculatus]|uniref:bestrophin-1-like isoform X2 n=1 Tax=Portunus trituberculatus TaxID=210409 RepID=UPI001E1D09CC|nr:bestrophin-1-like isoform X2 [Portunus trituberculatus]XP_045114603.1 bestrophin-1-like isoform X2 [Portunus trituberculatus]XP_045114604.1 bestrophin-1-like isoform X2 [Portunus trituberculatus]XP_045114605.1 bestrophin-1-like isoform X2 [Portunus trituberculatus]XP_045114606.1 bestrophin-1-like isoform X2 [Portunus trituberculatus]XP_045114607.1 bestrophin-1-like isoform X2 [Portunus trituberculatus]XP_045114608.1 bestrophin-1-like isoform X2 [Portunus trituberculatus]XP_045114609.1 bes